METEKTESSVVVSRSCGRGNGEKRPNVYSVSFRRDKNASEPEAAAAECCGWAVCAAELFTLAKRLISCYVNFIAPKMLN